MGGWVFFSLLLLSTQTHTLSLFSSHLRVHHPFLHVPNCARGVDGGGADAPRVGVVPVEGGERGAVVRPAAAAATASRAATARQRGVQRGGGGACCGGVATTLILARHAPQAQHIARGRQQVSCGACAAIRREREAGGGVGVHDARARGGGQVARAVADWCALCGGAGRVCVRGQHRLSLSFSLPPLSTPPQQPLLTRHDVDAVAIVLDEGANRQAEGGVWPVLWEGEGEASTPFPPAALPHFSLSLLPLPPHSHSRPAQTRGVAPPTCRFRPGGRRRRRRRWLPWRAGAGEMEGVWTQGGGSATRTRSRLAVWQQI